MKKLLFVISFLFVSICHSQITIVITVGSGGEDFSTILAGDDSADVYSATLDTLTEVRVSAGNYAENLVINGRTTDVDSYKIITVAVADRGDGTEGTAPTIDPTSDGHAVSIEDQYTRFEYFEILGWQGANFTNAIAIQINASSQVGRFSHIRYNLIHDPDDSGAKHLHGIGVGAAFAAMDVEIYYNVIYDINETGAANQGYGIQVSGSADCMIWNNTVHNVNDDGIIITNASATNIIANNNMVFDSANFDYNLTSSATWDATSSNNMSSDTTGADPGATGAIINETASSEFTNLTDGSQDFHLLSTADAINAGSDEGLTTDHDGDTVPSGSEDMGFDQFTSAVTVKKQIIVY